MTVPCGMSPVVAELSRHGTPQSCGLVAAMTLIGSYSPAPGHHQGGNAQMLQMLAGYLDGLQVKAALLAGFGLAWAAGAGGWAWAAALAAATTALLTQCSLRPRRRLRPQALASAHDTDSPAAQ